VAENRKWICQYCGGRATVSNGKYMWCSSLVCQRKHDLDICEPNLGVLRFNATVFGRFRGFIGWLLLEPFVRLIPPTWVWNYKPRTWRYEIWGWVNSSSYWWYERMKGRC